MRSNHKGTQPISTIEGLTQILNNLDPCNNMAALASIDASIIRIDASIVRIDGSLSVLFNEDIYLKNYIDGSIFLINSSLNEIYLYYNNLNASLNVLDSSSIKGFSNIGGGAEIYKETIDNVANLRTIVSGSPNVVIDQCTNTISISVGDVSTGAIYWTDVTPISASVGGLWPDATLYGMSSIDVLEDILYEYKNPNITMWTEPSYGFYEKDSSLTYIPDISIYATFNNDPFKKALINKIDLYKKGYFYLGSTTLYPNVSNGSYSFYDPAGLTLTDAWEDCEFKLKVYNTVDTNNYISEASVNFSFVHPYYWGTLDKNKNFTNITYDDIINLNKLLVGNQTNTITYNIDVSLQNVKFVYAIPDEYNYLSAIYDLRNNFNVLNSFDVSIMGLLAPNGHIIPYKVYLKTQWVDISDFSYTLKFNI